jgi:hypothetical protein
VNGEGIGRRKELELDTVLRRLAYVDDTMRAEWPLDDADVRVYVAALVVVADAMDELRQAVERVTS